MSIDTKSKVWLTSDLHFGHNKPFIYEARGFNTIETHDIAVLANFNSLVSDDDDVYILGDLGLGGDERFAKNLELIGTLNGKLHIAYGNHDSDKRIEAYKRLSNVVEVGMGFRIRHRKVELVLTHYPTLVANHDDPKPIYNIHGHTHSAYRWNSGAPHCYNVSLEATNMFPITLDEALDDIKADMRRKKGNSVH